MSKEGILSFPQSSSILSLVWGLGSGQGLGSWARLGLGPRLVATQTQRQMGCGLRMRILSWEWGHTQWQGVKAVG